MASFTAFLGVQTTRASSLPTAETTRVFTTGLLISTRTTMVTTPRTKAMESLTPSHRKEPSGTIAMVMVTATILLRLSNLTNVQTTGVTAPKTDSDAQIPMAMAGPTSTTGLQATKSNGSMRTTMDMATIISTNSTRINFTSTNVVMRFQMMQHNGTTPMVTVTATTTKMFHGTNIELLNGLVKSSLVHKTSTCFHLTEHSGEIPMVIGLATNR